MLNEKVKTEKKEITQKEPKTERKHNTANDKLSDKEIDKDENEFYDLLDSVLKDKPWYKPKRRE